MDRILADRSDDPYVAEIIKRDVPRVEASAGVDEVQTRMGADRTRLMAVFSGKRFLSLVSREDVSEALSILMFTARREAACARPGLRNPSAVELDQLHRHPVVDDHRDTHSTLPGGSHCAPAEDASTIGFPDDPSEFVDLRNNHKGRFTANAR